MRNDYEIAEVQVIGSAQDVIMGSKVDDFSWESDLDHFLYIMDDDE